MQNIPAGTEVSLGMYLVSGGEAVWGGEGGEKLLFGLKQGSLSPEGPGGGVPAAGLAGKGGSWAPPQGSPACGKCSRVRSRAAQGRSLPSIRMHFTLGFLKTAELKFTPYLMRSPCC